MLNWGNSFSLCPVLWIVKFQKSDKRLYLFQKYESKQQTLKTYEAAYRPNYQNMGGKINKMKASVDISKKLYQYRQLEETAARQHLLMVNSVLFLAQLFKANDVVS